MKSQLAEVQTGFEPLVYCMCEENTSQKERFLQEVEQKLLRKELDARLTQNLTVTPPDTPVAMENRMQCNASKFLLEVRKVPQLILGAFNENDWTFVIDGNYTVNLGRQLGVNCIGATVFGENRIYVSESGATLHEFGHFYDSLLGFPEEHDRLYELEAAKAPMSEHAKSSMEYFAEFFAYWCSGNTRTLALLKELTPETYAYFEGLSASWLF